MLKKILFGILLITNLYFIGHMGFVTHMLSDWFINDSLAFRLDTIGWAKIALNRFFMWSTIGLVLAIIVFFINKLLFYLLLKKKNKLHIYFSIALFCNIILATLIGSIQFYITKPWF